MQQKVDRARYERRMRMHSARGRGVRAQNRQAQDGFIEMVRLPGQKRLEAPIRIESGHKHALVLGRLGERRLGTSAVHEFIDACHALYRCSVTLVVSSWWG